MENPEYQELQNELKRAQRELAVLYEISNAMHTTLDLQHILYIILTGVTAHTGLGFNRAILFLYNPLERRLEPQMAIGPESGEAAQNIWQYITQSGQSLDDLIDAGKIEKNVNQSSLMKSIKNIRIPLTTDENNLLANAFHLGNPMHLKEHQIKDYQNDLLLKSFPTKEIVIMPLKAKDKVNGLIVADNLYTQKKISDHDLKMFMMLANQAGLAIENSQLYQQIKEQSDLDALTQVWNHGYFQKKLSEEIFLHEKINSPVGLMLLDIDNFKNLNDTHGHQIGDAILKKTADILKDSSRDIDYVCRYGGEEFSIILPGTTKEHTIPIAERIRERIANHMFEINDQKNPLAITVSIGIAVLPEDAATKEQLIQKADKAMYAAKFSGKNKVMAFPI